MVDAGKIHLLSRQERIPLEFLVREAYEVAFLKILAESPVGSRLVFRGGTALRLAYGCPRFSMDLDFSALKPVEKSDMEPILRGWLRTYPTCTVTDFHQKRWTLVVELKIQEALLDRPFRQLFEVTNRPFVGQEGVDYALRVLSSPTATETALLFVASLDRLAREKDSVLKDRKEPRDVFDRWWIAQMRKEAYVVSLAGYEKTVVKRELRKYLPPSYWRVVDTWLAAA